MVNNIQQHLRVVTETGGQHPSAGMVKVVDAGGDLWSLDDDRPGPAGWTSGCAAGPYANLALPDAAHGPLHPVLPAPPGDRERIVAALRKAGDRAVSTVHAALRDVHRQLVAENGAAPRAAFGPWWAWALQYVAPEQAGPASGLINLFGSLGGLVGPLVVGCVAGDGAVADGFYALGFFLLASGIVALGIVRFAAKPAAHVTAVSTAAASAAESATAVSIRAG